MSFLRPEVARLFSRWAETAAYFAALGVGLWFVLAHGPSAPLWRFGLAGVVVVLGFWFIRSAALDALLGGAGEAPGVVKIDERRIAYFGPHQGGVVSIDDVFAIEIWTADEAHWRYEAEWVLRWSETEAALIIPVSAAGADALPDAFAALPGFAAERALAALSGAEGATFTIWRRRVGSAPPALAPPTARA